MIARRHFGTDGVRGVANTELSPQLALALGAAAVQTLGADRPLLIGRDPRRSGDLLEAAFVAGVLSQGADAVRLGVLPTPGVSFATRTRPAAAGIVISASHNPVADNGIKFFGPDGHKLADDVEARIEAAMEGWESRPRPSGTGVGRVRDDHGQAVAAYAAFLGATLLPHDLAGLTLVLDCAHGAASAIAPRLFADLGARVVAVGAAPDGDNINVACGSTHPEAMARAVLEHGADAGLAFDGDADRVILCDRRGRIFDGDRILCAAGLHAKARGRLPGDVVVGTIMSNLGLEKRLADAGIRLERAGVGDRYVAARMAAVGAVLGGEQSGHILFPEIAPTGDGMLTGLQILKIVRDSGRDLASWADEMDKYPQTIVNVDVRDKDGWDASPALRAAIADAEARLDGRGRINVRPSGTEKKIRVMVESPDRDEVDAVARAVADVIRAERGV